MPSLVPGREEGANSGGVMMMDAVPDENLAHIGQSRKWMRSNFEEVD